MSDFTELVDLASERLGGAVLAANDEFFAPKENLLRASPPVFLEGKYTDRGKWMDGWETRRRRAPGYDWCIVRLGLAGILRGAIVDTSHFKGNYPEHCSIEACAGDGLPDAAQLTDPATRWVEVLPKSALRGDSQNPFSIENPHRFTHLRLKIYPDGGVARLRVYGEVLPDWRQLGWQDGEIDLAAIENGGRVLACNDMFFGSRHNLIMPGRAMNMSDGWETRRRRGPGHDWAIVQLAAAGTVRRVEVDTSHFKGNYPESCSIEVFDAGGKPLEDFSSASLAWQEILPRTKLEAHTRHFFRDEIRETGPVTHLRFNIFPDGGVARLRVYGTVRKEGRLREGIRWLNALVGKQAERELLACCGSTNWASHLAAQRPFGGWQQLLDAGDNHWRELGRQDWLEAFSRHPKIGEKAAAPSESAQTLEWSCQEQAGVRDATAETVSQLAEANRAYQAKFGYIFIVCATGKTSDQMLALLRQRLQNDADAELRVAAEEQRKITHLRLEKLLTQ